jgi:hypothetical protein
MMKSRRTQRSKSLPNNQSPKKSFFSIISRRLSLSSRLRANSVRLYDDSEDDDTVQVIPQEVISPQLLSQCSFLTYLCRFNHQHNLAFPDEPLVSGLSQLRTNSTMMTLRLNLPRIPPMGVLMFPDTPPATSQRQLPTASP